MDALGGSGRRATVSMMAPDRVGGSGLGSVGLKGAHLVLGELGLQAAVWQHFVAGREGQRASREHRHLHWGICDVHV